jgi:replication-associated recombination protein RarA
MIPRTLNGLGPFVCISAMQKFIRRGMEREAMEVAAEMCCTSKAFCSMVCNRLLIISHEDIGLANPGAAPFVAAAVQTARDLWDKDKPGKALIPIGNAIRMMCRGPKSREGDHFAIAVGLSIFLGLKKPAIPEWVYDVHTAEGRKMGRGFEHFWTESTKLRNESGAHDPYKAEAEKVLRHKMSLKQE